MKTLLTIHDIEQPIGSLKPVILLAEELGAHLDVVVLGVIRNVAVAASPGVPAVYFHDANDELINEGKARVGEVQTMLAKTDLSHSVMLECRDAALIENVVLGHAMLADATVFPDGNVLNDDALSRSFNGALLRSGRPVLFLGQKGKPLKDIGTVLYAWNGEPESAKAMHHSLNWIDGATKAHVVLVDPDEYKVGENPGDDVAAFLSRNHLVVSVDRIPRGSRDVASVLMQHASDIGADLIVMGGYSHSRFREWLIGGTTRSTLKEANIPILMAH
ncbi:universal stress protein [Pseudahrensia aquimaris]|uniref:Universal stress protein n=1 Tax=Pseudahrensia aquimaris TaxID=744461 RepID=A0ABW3FC15_9HYPH